MAEINMDWTTEYQHVQPEQHVETRDFEGFTL